MKFKILISDKIADEGIRLLEEKCCQVTKAWDIQKTELQNTIGEYDAIIVRSATKITADLIVKANKLKVISAVKKG